MQAFQSTPAIADGRTQRAAVLRALGELFQSTPAIADGRTAASALWKRSARQFQSTPAIADGRTDELHEGFAVHVEVSIHARHR